MASKRLLDAPGLILSDRDRTSNLVRDIIFAAVIYIALFCTRDIFRAYFDYNHATKPEDLIYKWHLVLLHIGEFLGFLLLSVLVGIHFYSWAPHRRKPPL